MVTAARPRANERDFMEVGQVAFALGISAQLFRRRRADMERDQLFPRPMPYARHPMLWRRDQVLKWIADQGLPRPADPPPPRPSGPNVRLLEEARRA